MEYGEIWWNLGLNMKFCQITQLRSRVGPILVAIGPILVAIGPILVAIGPFLVAMKCFSYTHGWN